MARNNKTPVADDAESTAMEFGMQGEPTPGGSKRKRSGSGLAYAAYLSAGREADQDSHTPKRNRQTNWPLTEGETSNDGSDIKQRSVRRKHGKYGLSTISRRHAREESDRGSGSGSKFKEGSMNDKPSALPPSLFTRDTSDHSLVSSAHSANVDHLMEEYNGGHVGEHIEPRYMARQRVEFADPHMETTIPLSPTAAAKESSFYRFGRMVASSFNPGNMWSSFSRTLKDTKDEMTVRNIEENRRRDALAQQKAEAEAKYAEMKASGQFGFTILANRVPPPPHPPPPPHSPPPPPPVRNHEDEPNKNLDMAEQVPRHSAPADDAPYQDMRMASPRASESTVPGSPSFNRRSDDSGFLYKSVRSRKSFFGIHRPSFSNLKRARSDYTLGLGIANQSDPSLSPEKKDAAQEGAHTLLRSHSKKDLGKQRKLSQRVSDLELKLADARRELSSAINNASPLPELPSRFERYTPSKNTPLARFKSRFVPGQLPSLPSERLLFEEHPNPGDEDEAIDAFTPAPRNIPTQPRVSHTTDFTPVPPPRSNPLPEAFNFREKPLPEPPVLEETTQTLAGNTQVDMDDMADMSASSLRPDQVGENYNDLDARLKALNQHVEGKDKRKSGVKKRKGFEDKDYKPGNDSDEEEEATNKPKKRKSTTSKSGGKPDGRKAPKKSSPPKKTVNGKKKSSPTASEQAAEWSPLPTPVAAPEAADNLTFDATSSDIDSLDTSPAKPLEPIYEEVSFSSSKHGTGNGVYDAIQGKHVHSSSRSSASQYPPRSRSASPNKNCTTHHAQAKRLGSPPPEKYTEAELGSREVVTATPGVGSVPDMPKPPLGTKHIPANGAVKEKKKTATDRMSEDFEWPEDVF